LLTRIRINLNLPETAGFQSFFKQEHQLQCCILKRIDAFTGDVMTQQPLLNFQCHGQIAEDLLREIHSNLEECYSRLSRWLPERVEVRLFTTTEQIAVFLTAEKAKLGIKTLGDEAFICSHDAWHGYPRILICLEKLLAISPLAQLGALRHEVAHSVIHGSLASYVVRIPPNCLELAKAKSLDMGILQQVLYYCATAAKDFEVTRLLVHQGYRECQVAFVQTQFLPSEEDELAWLLARSHPQGKLLFFTGQLKTLLMGWPLEAAGLMHIEKSTDLMLKYMEPGERNRLVSFAKRIAKQLGENTQDNVSSTLTQVLKEPF
jgi:hypothetical protein